MDTLCSSEKLTLPPHGPYQALEGKQIAGRYHRPFREVTLAKLRRKEIGGSRQCRTREWALSADSWLG